MFDQIKFIFSFVILIIKKIITSMAETVNDILHEEGISEQNLEAFLKEKSVSELLTYRGYTHDDDRECGIYHMCDNRKAIILRIYPPAFVSDKTETKLTNFFSSIELEDTVVQFTTFASRNIEKHIKRYEDFHTGNTVNVDNPKILKDLINKRVSELRRWTNESMSKGVDFRIKDFQNLLVMLFPIDTKDEYIYKTFDEIKGGLEDFYPENYCADNLLSMLSEIFYFDKSPEFWDSEHDPIMEMNQQIASRGLSISTKKKYVGFKINKKTYTRVLTTNKFPKDLSLFEYNNVFFDKMGNTSKIPISSPFLLSLTLRFDNIKKRKEETLSKLKHDLVELSKLRPIDLKNSPALAARLKETEESIYALEEGGEDVIKGMWTLSIQDSSLERLNEQVASVKQKFQELGWELIEEYSNNIALLTFLYSLPGMYQKVVEETSSRFRILFKGNHASMAPIIGGSLGAGDYNLLTVDRTGQIQRWDPFAKGAAENPNIIKAGGSGSGKSFSETEFHMSSVSAGYLLRVIDAGGSYETFCKSIGGQYIEFEEHINLSLNFFTKALTSTDLKGNIILHPEEISAMTSTVGLMGGVNLTHEFKASSDVANVGKVGIFTEAIIKAINTSFERAGHAAKLEDVRDVLMEIASAYKEEGRVVSEELLNFASSLYRFADKKGPFYKYFNPPNNVDFTKDYVVIETQSLLNISNDLFVVVVAILTNQIKNEFFDKEKIERRKILTVDEAKPVLDNEISLELLIQIYRKIRKYNGLANTITQSMNDFFSNDKVRVLYEIAGWKWFLKQNDGVINEAYQAGKLNVSPFEKRLLESIKNNPPNYGEYFISSENVTLISRLKTDSLAFWMYTTDGSDKAKVKNFMKKYELSEVDARIALSLLQDGESIDSAVDMARKKQLVRLDKDKVLKLCNKAVNRSIENHDMIEIWGMDVVNKTDFNNVSFTELFTHPENSDGISNKDIYSNRKYINNILEYEKAVLTKLLEHVAERNGIYSINISIESLSDNIIYSVMRDFSLKHSSDVQRIIFEIPLAHLDYDENDFLNSNISDIQKLGFKIINDNLKNGDRIANILKYKIDYVKISPEIYADGMESHISEITLAAVKAISEKNPIKVIATMVSSAEEFENVKKLKYIDVVQGFYISERKIKH